MNVRDRLSLPLIGLMVLMLGSHCHASQAGRLQPEHAANPITVASRIRIEDHLLTTEDRAGSRERPFVASRGAFSAGLLHRQSPVRLGSVGGDAVYATLDAIRDDGYLAFTAGGTSAIVISHFLDYEGLHLDRQSDTDNEMLTWTTELGKAVLSKIREFDPAQAERLGEILNAARTQPGTVLHFQLEDQGPKRSTFTHCYALLFQIGASAEQKLETIRLGLNTILADANRRAVQHLIVPPLTVKYWEYREEEITYLEENLSPAALYQTILDEIQMAPATPAVYIGMYSGWPGKYLNYAVSELQRVIQARDSEKTE